MVFYDIQQVSREKLLHCDGNLPDQQTLRRGNYGLIGGPSFLNGLVAICSNVSSAARI